MLEQIIKNIEQLARDFDSLCGIIEILISDLPGTKSIEERSLRFADHIVDLTASIYYRSDEVLYRLEELAKIFRRDPNKEANIRITMDFIYDANLIAKLLYLFLRDYVIYVPPRVSVNTLTELNKFLSPIADNLKKASRHARFWL